MNKENLDPLTGLANWKYVSSILPGILGHNGQVALILIDVDRLKSVNDTFGLNVGDEKLVEIAQQIEASSAEGALVFRVGGDELGVILYEASLEHAREVAEGIRAARKPEAFETWDKKPVEALTLSIGIAHFPTHATTPENLLRAADLALMKAKGEGNSRLANGETYLGRNRVMAIGDFWDDFPEQSAEFLK